MDVTRPARRLVLPAVVGLLGSALALSGLPGDAAPGPGPGEDPRSGTSRAAAPGDTARATPRDTRRDVRGDTPAGAVDDTPRLTPRDAPRDTTAVPPAAVASAPRSAAAASAPADGGASEMLAPVAVTAEDPGPTASAPEPPTTRLVVLLDDDATPRAATAAAERLGAEAETPLPELGAYAVEAPAGTADDVARTLASRDDVDDVVVARRREVLGVPDDPQWPAQATAMRAVRAPEAWGVTRGRADVTVAVVDTGLDVTHPDLAGKVAATYNAVTGHETTDGVAGSDVGEHSRRFPHGTAVASVAAATTGNGVGIAGAGGRTRVLAVKVADENGAIWSDTVAEGIAWAADHGADVVNVSLGSRYHDALEAKAVAYARSKGVVVVAAAGNSGTRDRHYPAALPGVLAVGATGPDGTGRASFSTYGPWVDVAAPGERVRAARAGGGYVTVAGTSFSAPLVAGQVALVTGHRPAWGPGRVVDAVRTTTRRRGLPFAYGLVDFRASLRGPRVDDTAPRLTVTGGGSRAFRPGARGRDGRARLVVRSSETLRSLELRVRGPRTARAYTVQRRGVLAGVRSFTWDGRRAHRRVPAGRYRFRFVGVDLAGNRTFSAVRTVRVRR